MPLDQPAQQPELVQVVFEQFDVPCALEVRQRRPTAKLVSAITGLNRRAIKGREAQLLLCISFRRQHPPALDDAQQCGLLQHSEAQHFGVRLLALPRGRVGRWRRQRRERLAQRGPLVKGTRFFHLGIMSCIRLIRSLCRRRHGPRRQRGAWRVALQVSKLFRETLRVA